MPEIVVANGTVNVRRGNETIPIGNNNLPFELVGEDIIIIGMDANSDNCTVRCVIGHQIYLGAERTLQYQKINSLNRYVPEVPI